MKLVIDRQTWMRGDEINQTLTYPNGTQKYYNPALLRDNGCMCCLGFLCIQNGLTKEDILNVSLPSQIEKLLPTEIEWLLTYISSNDDHDFAPVQAVLSSINDNSTLTEEEREQQLTVEFAKYGVKVKFIN